MRIGIFGRKVGMTQVFDERGALVAATVIDTSDCVITQVKTKDKDGYVAIQVGVERAAPAASAGGGPLFRLSGVTLKAEVRQKFPAGRVKLS